MAKGGARSWAIRRMRAQAREGSDVWASRRRECANALLNRPWIRKDEDPELFYWVKDQYRELRDWFAEFTGFVLLLTRTMAKLDKAPLHALPWMGFGEFRESRDYVFFTYGLWYLENKSELDQFLLTDMAEHLREQMVGEGMAVDWTHYPHRLSMVRALKKLRQLGALSAIDGEEGDWANNKEQNVLYECSPHARYMLRQFPQELNRYESLHDLHELAVYPETTEGELRQRRHRVYRRLLLEPVVMDRDWEPEDLKYIVNQRRSIADQLQLMFGWTISRYREGLLVFHPELTGESALFPTAAAMSDLAMLFAGEIRRRIHREDAVWYPENDGSIVLTRSDMETLLLVLQQKHKPYWSKEQQDMTSAELASGLMAHLVEWSLGRWISEEKFALSPALSRWNAEYRSEDSQGFE
ncbi:TIGR02678 family protein [Cohnella xylanilytica]|uniref:TIGR02678 family protein n=1 Tax=Cohnella xylanilytica TaxID=557555 RepID=A0A841U1B6_9BACL|nr:TIGR02678 family protein [Cohnella xylanilytica]MBB6693579.1 TIGR02678 family protein [Cohnella xylanilytica]GIO14777.1 TIGR02678 family protein [Cohnella xylanilytica]